MSTASDRMNRRSRAIEDRKRAAAEADVPVKSEKKKKKRAKTVEAEVVTTPRRRSQRLAVLDDVETIVPNAADIDPDEAEDDEDDAPAPRVRANVADLSARRRARQEARGESASPRALAIPNEDLTRQLDPGDVIMPKIRISQAMSAVNKLFAESRGKEGVGMGSWYHTTQGKDLGDTIYFIPVDMRKTRSLFIQGQGLVCRSFNLLQGEGTPGILCEGTFEERHEYPAEERGCELRLWKRDENSNTPPACGITFNYPGFVIVDADEDEPKVILQGLLQLRGTGTSAAKAINTAAMKAGMNWHNLVMEMSITSKKNQRGTFYVPTAEEYGRTTDPEFRHIIKQVQDYARSARGIDIRASIDYDDME